MSPSNVDIQIACDEIIEIVFSKAMRNIHSEMVLLGAASLRLIGRLANVYFQGTIFYRSDHVGIPNVSLHPSLVKKGEYLLFQLKNLSEDSARINQTFTRLCVLKDYKGIRTLLPTSFINNVENLTDQSKQTLLSLPTPTNSVESPEYSTIIYYYIKSLS